MITVRKPTATEPAPRRKLRSCGYESTSSRSDPRASDASDSTSKDSKCRDVPESYTERVPYDYAFKYAVVGSTLSKRFNLTTAYYHVGAVDLSNAENTGGNFTVTYNFRTAARTTPVTQVKYVASHSTQHFEMTYNSSHNEDVTGTYTVQAPHETRFNEETRYKTTRKCD